MKSVVNSHFSNCNMDVVKEILEKSAYDVEKYKSITVNKHIDLVYDLGTLLATDTNELDTELLRKRPNDYLRDLARDNAQLLVNQIWDLPTERVDGIVVGKFPPQKTVLPRMKPVPRPKPLTKWQQFAKDKGIQKKKKNKLSWDEQLRKWVPTYGFKRAQSEKEKSWLLEVPGNADPMEDQFAKKSQATSEKVAKNELQRLRNIAKAKKIKIPRVGVTNSEVSTAKDLQTAVTVAKASTASLGKFQSKLPKEKEARGVADITPGVTRKRKLPPVSGAEERSENLAIVDTILNKKPKLDIEKAVARHISNEQLERSQEKQSSGNRSSKGKGKANSKKPKGGKGQRKGKTSGGRKRR
ncbi:ribosome biogenesis regulatory protein homolog [Leptinotarsa decemlineata]|uniref:ribosome biogenesis regulatory protein homolog n=1 Tax=Leptinotarsa decemlineata TaxID=7539 RepID=UPI000C25378D|nr:ribosome biogenesis regulatory protein homolog [Leptinotarsa decemlineata]